MTQPVPWELGVQLRAARERLGLSGREVARRAGISETRLRQLETGFHLHNGVRTPTSAKPSTVLAVANVVNLDPAQALAWAGFDAINGRTDDQVDADLRGQLLDVYDQLELHQRVALVKFVQTLSTTG